MKRSSERRALGLASVLLLVGVVVALATSCSAVSTLTLVGTRPGQVVGVVGYSLPQYTRRVEVRRTVGTSAPITVQAYLGHDPVASLPPSTIAGMGDAWVPVAVSPGLGPLLPPDAHGELTLRLTAASLADLPLTIEVRAFDLNDLPIGPVTPVSPFGADCGRITPHTDHRTTQLAGLDLHNCIVPGVTLDPAHLTGTDLRGAELSLATILPGTLDGTKLTGAHLGGAHLAGVDLSKTAGFDHVDLADADLSHAVLRGVGLRGSNLAGTELATATLDLVRSGATTGTPVLPAGWVVRNGYLVHRSADLELADLHDADISGLDLRGAHLRGADLFAANLSGTQLAGAQLTEVVTGNVTGTPSSVPDGWRFVHRSLVGATAYIFSADLTGADLSGMDLHEIDFGASTLTNVDLHGTNLHGAHILNLAGADLTDADVTDATVNFELTGATITGADFTGATFSSVISGGLVGQPAALPAGYVIVNGYFIGPGAALNDADLRGADLHGVSFASVAAPDAHLEGANIADTDFTGAYLSGAFLTGAVGTPIYAGVDFASVTCPDGTLGSAHGNTCQGHPWT